MHRGLGQPWREFDRLYVMFPAEDSVGGALVQGGRYIPSLIGCLPFLNAGESLEPVVGRVEAAEGRVLTARKEMGEWGSGPRRLVIGEAARFPDLGHRVAERGQEAAMSALANATSFDVAQKDHLSQILRHLHERQARASRASGLSTPTPTSPQATGGVSQ